MTIVYRKILTLLTLVTLGAVQLGCKGEEVNLSIFHTNDIHCYLRAAPTAQFGLGGVAKLGTRLHQLRAEKTGPHITLDAGDWCEGTWYHAVDTGAGMLKLFDLMDYDAVVLGNHDYLIGPDEITMTVAEAAPRFPVLGANFDFTNYPDEANFRKQVAPTTIITRGDLKIGVIGLSTMEAPFTPFLKPVQATDPVAEAQARAKELRPLVDVLVILSHNNFGLNRQIARATLGVDAVISGHSHVKVPRAELIDNAGRQVPVVETGEHAQFLGELNLTVDRKNKIVRFNDYFLHPISPDLQDDIAVAAGISEMDDALDHRYGGDVDEIVADSEVRLDHDDSHRATLGNLATKGYRDATGADIAFEVLPLNGVTMKEGPVTVRNLHDVMPHVYRRTTGKEWTIKIWTAKGSDIAVIINAFFTLPNLLPLQHTGFLGMDGITVEWEPKHEGNPAAHVREIRIGGTPLDLNREYSVAITDGMLMAVSLVDQLVNVVDLSKVTETGVEGWRSILAYGMNAGTLTEDGLRAGGRSFTTIADPTIHPYSISPSAAGLIVQLSNEGLRATPSMTIACSNGPVNDFINHGTQLESAYVEFHRANIPALAAGSKTTVDVSWNPPAGWYAIRCEVISIEDGYKGNSAATVVLEMGTSK